MCAFIFLLGVIQSGGESLLLFFRSFIKATGFQCICCFFFEIAFFAFAFVIRIEAFRIVLFTFFTVENPSFKTSLEVWILHLFIELRIIVLCLFLIIGLRIFVSCSLRVGQVRQSGLKLFSCFVRQAFCLQSFDDFLNHRVFVIILSAVNDFSVGINGMQIDNRLC